MTQAIDWQQLDLRNEERYVQKLLDAGVIRDGHFVLRSGLHTHKFVDIKGLYPHTRIAKQFGRALGLRIQRELGLEGIEQVAGIVAPAIGGIVLAHDTADWVGLMSQEFDRDVRALFAEKDPLNKEKFVFGRGYDEFIPGKHWVIVEDVTTTGSAIKAIVDEIHRLEGIIDLACAIWDRGNVADGGIEGVKLISLINKQMPTFDVPRGADCPHCLAEEPIDTKHGRGADYVKEHGQPGAA